MIESLEVSTKVEQKPAGILLHARSGLGKTTMVGNFIKNSAKGILFQCGEDGLSDLDSKWAEGITHYSKILGDGATLDTMADGWLEFMDILKYLMAKDHGYVNIGFDSFDNLVNNNLDAYVIREYYGGSTKDANAWGGAKLKEMYSELSKVVKAFEYLQKKKGISIFITLHSQPVNFRDPSVPDYKKWSLAIPSREDYNLRSLLINWASVAMFGTLDVEVEDKKATGSKRVLRTVENASWEAKCRYKIPETIDFTFDSFKQAIIEKGEK